MAGLHGIGPALPVPAALAGAGAPLAGLAARGFISAAPLGVSAENATNIVWMVLLYGIVWGLPNTQQFMDRYGPALGKIQPGPLPWLRWRMTRALGRRLRPRHRARTPLSLGGTTEFLYFQF